MARLTAAARNALPASAFAGPSRTFPIPDKSHKIAAERMVGRSVKAGNISAGTGARIKAKAKKGLAHKIGKQLMNDHDADD
jgi:hypothetical protein